MNWNGLTFIKCTFCNKVSSIILMIEILLYMDTRSCIIHHYSLFWQIEREEDRWFKSVVLVGDKKYSSTEWWVFISKCQLFPLMGT